LAAAKVESFRGQYFKQVTQRARTPGAGEVVLFASYRGGQPEMGMRKSMSEIYYRSFSVSAFLFRVGFLAELHFSYLQVLGAFDFHR
jgi:hypothetical protein